MKEKELNHLAIILDGNGRWAKNRNMPRSMGHKEGSENVVDIALYAKQKGIKYLTLYAFSTENWKRPKIEVSAFSGSLRPEELIDWINEIDEYFECEEIKDPDRVRFAKTKLKGHANIWWREVQLERGRGGKEKITKWNRMVHKLKKQFIKVDYELDMFKKMQALKKTNKSVQRVYRGVL